MFALSKKVLNILSIAAIGSVFSGCLHATFPKEPVYRECLAVNDNGKKLIYCETMGGPVRSESYPMTDGYLSQFLMIPLQDVPRLEKFEAEVRTWVDANCK